MYNNISAVIHCIYIYIYIVGMGIGMPAFLLQYPSRSAHTFTPLCNGNGVSCLSFSPFSPPNMNMILQLRLFINRQRYLTWQALKQVTTHHFALAKHPRKAAISICKQSYACEFMRRYCMKSPKFPCKFGVTEKCRRVQCPKKYTPDVS